MSKESFPYQHNGTSSIVKGTYCSHKLDTACQDTGRTGPLLMNPMKFHINCLRFELGRRNAFKAFLPCFLGESVQKVNGSDIENLSLAGNM